MTEWEQENEAFLKKIGQVSTPTPKPVTKKEEE